MTSVNTFLTPPPAFNATRLVSYCQLFLSWLSKNKKYKKRTIQENNCSILTSNPVTDLPIGRRKALFEVNSQQVCHCQMARLCPGYLKAEERAPVSADTRSDWLGLNCSHLKYNSFSPGTSHHPLHATISPNIRRVESSHLEGSVTDRHVFTVMDLTCFIIYLEWNDCISWNPL